MPIITTGNSTCPTCGECCDGTCWQEIKCLYDCCGCCSVPILMGPNQDLMAGQIMAQKTSDGKFYAYSPTGTDGLNYPRGVLKYNTLTDENGRVIRYNAPRVGTLCGPLYSNMYICGTFRNEEILGDLSAALTTGFFGRLIEGLAHSPGYFLLS